MVLPQLDSVIGLIPGEFFSHDLLQIILEKIIGRVESSYHIDVKAGIGTSYEYIEDFRKWSYQEAKNTLAISKISVNEKKVYFYEKLGIYH